MQLLGEILKDNQKLEKLGLRYCNLEKNSFLALFEGLINNNSITSLDISHNKLNSVEACTKLSQALSKSEVIRELHLSDCILNSKHLTEIADGLAENVSLNRLHLDHNTINIQGLRTLAFGVKESKTLQLLTLQDTNLTTADTIEFIRRLGRWKSQLEILDVRNNPNIEINDDQFVKYTKRYSSIMVKHDKRSLISAKSKIMNTLRKI